MASSEDLMAMGRDIRNESAAALDQLRRDITASFTQVNDAALQEIKTQTKALSDEVAQSQAALAGLVERATAAKFAAAEAGFLAEQRRVQSLNDELEARSTALKAAIETVSEWKLAEVPQLLLTYSQEHKTMVNTVHQLLRSDIEVMDKFVRGWSADAD